MTVPIPLKKNEITDPTVGRLVGYRRLLSDLATQKVLLVSSKDMGELLGIKPSQVRKDLSYLGEFGKRGVGYNVQCLLADLSDILAPFQRWHIGLVGLGRLGEALLDHSAFVSPNYKIEVLFDIDQAKVGHTFSGRLCYHADDLAETIVKMDLGVLILTVPPAAAQSLVNAAVSTGRIQGILNFVPTAIVVPESVEVKDVDISVELEKLLFKLKFNEQQKMQQKK